MGIMTIADLKAHLTGLKQSHITWVETAIETVDFLNRRIGELLEANNRYLERYRFAEQRLKKAGEQFRLYERLHSVKETPEGNAKAEVNRQMAEMCEEKYEQKT